MQLDNEREEHKETLGTSLESGWIVCFTEKKRSQQNLGGKAAEKQPVRPNRRKQKGRFLSKMSPRAENTSRTRLVYRSQKRPLGGGTIFSAHFIPFLLFLQHKQLNGNKAEHEPSILINGNQQQRNALANALVYSQNGPTFLPAGAGGDSGLFGSYLVKCQWWGVFI